MSLDVLKELERLLDARRDQGGTITRINENDAILRLADKIRADERELAARPEARRSEVRLNGAGTLDEVVTTDGDQLEQMDYNHWFLQIADTAIWLHAKGKITATYEKRTEPQSSRNDT